MQGNGISGIASAPAAILCDGEALCEALSWGVRSPNGTGPSGADQTAGNSMPEGRPDEHRQSWVSVQFGGRSLHGEAPDRFVGGDTGKRFDPLGVAFQGVLYRRETLFPPLSTRETQRSFELL